MIHKDLEVWKQGIEMAKTLYELTKDFPPSELYGLTSQMRRSAISISSNIAEGSARSTDKEFIYFLHITLGSVTEHETQYIPSRDLCFSKVSASVEKGIENVRRMTVGPIKHMKNKQ